MNFFSKAQCQFLTSGERSANKILPMASIKLQQHECHENTRLETLFENIERVRKFHFSEHALLADCGFANRTLEV